MQNRYSSTISTKDLFTQKFLRKIKWEIRNGSPKNEPKFETVFRSVFEVFIRRKWFLHKIKHPKIRSSKKNKSKNSFKGIKCIQQRYGFFNDFYVFVRLSKFFCRNCFSTKKNRPVVDLIFVYKMVKKIYGLIRQKKNKMGNTIENS